VRWLDKSILVTGATGFIGGRVCERLVQAGAARVRALVHTVQRTPRIARLPIQLCVGSLLDRPSLRQAVGDSEIIIHCGLGVGRGIVNGTRNLLEIAEAASVKRFIHMSTAAVYGLTPPPGSETEDARPRPTGEPYCDNKMYAERVVYRFLSRGVPAVILRPSIVYGPYSFWSTRLITALRERSLALIDHGRGACNTTYVDNLVDAVLLSIENERAVGQTFFITDGEEITWGEFTRAHAAMLENEFELPEVSTEEFLTHCRQQPGFWTASLREARRILFSAELRKLLIQVPAFERVLSALWMRIESLSECQKSRFRSRLRGSSSLKTKADERVRYLPDMTRFATETATVFFRIDKARRILGYEPRVQFVIGMKVVEQWLRFANYL
jgi:nucleoside-diphosphate-sugar epimerase